MRGSACFGVAHSGGTNFPDLESYDFDGRRLGRWAIHGAGPNELQSIDGFAAFADTLLVWDRANSRVTYVNCRGEPVRSIQLGFVGFELAPLDGSAFLITSDQVASHYGVWVVDGQITDTVARIGPRLRGARDLLATTTGRQVAILDVSVGALLRFDRVAAHPSRVDTLPAGIQTVLRSAFRELWAENPVADAPVVPMNPLWAQMIGPDTLAIGYPEYSVTKGVAAVLWPIGSPNFISIRALPDSAARIGLYSIHGIVIHGDTLVTATRDSLYRFRLTRP